jgi:hypothetical protein
MSITNLRRVLVVLIVAVSIGLVWEQIGQTDLAASLDPLTAGEGFTNALEPLQLIVGWLLVAVPGTLLIRSLWRRIVRLDSGPRPRRHPALIGPNDDDGGSGLS